MYSIFYHDEFNKRDLEDNGKSLGKKFNELIADLEQNRNTNLGNIKLISSVGGIKYLRAKLSDKDRLLFTSIKYNGKCAFVILEVILNHDYHKSEFLTNKDKIQNIKVTREEISDNAEAVEIEDAPQVPWLGKFITLSATQEEIVKNADLPLVVSGAAGSGKTSIALEKLRKIEEKFKEGKVLYITQSENLIKRSKELYECEYYNQGENKLKIGIPDRIEFLSLHEFLEKQVEGIKGKKPVDRNKFFSWFNEICKKDKFKEYKKDGDKIFEEFTAVIAGGDLKKEEYKELGKRQAIFSEEKRDHVYGLFGEYKEFIEKDSKHYDINLIANQCNKKKVYDAVVVDEVQDLTKSTLGLILKSLKDESKGNFLLCGDVNQVVHPSFFSISRLESFLRKYNANEAHKFYVLEKNYRNSEQVIELANRVLHLKNYCFASEDKLTVNEREAFFMTSDTKNTGNVSFVAKDKEQEMAEKVSKSTNWVVLVLDETRKGEACKLFDTPLVFNIHEAKGLEFENVILYKFMSYKTYDQVLGVVCKNKNNHEMIESAVREVRCSYDEKDLNSSRAKDKKDKSFVNYKFYINALYVAVTRANKSVYIVGNKQYNLWKIVTPEKNVDIDIANIKKEESSPEEWKVMALELIDKGNIEQAKGIAEKLQLDGKTEYAKEIMNALEPSRSQAENTSSQPPKKYSMGITEKTGTNQKSNDKHHKNKQKPNESQENGIEGLMSRLRHNEAIDKLKKAGVSHCDTQQALIDIISNDKIGELKKIDISQYDKKHILEFSLQKSAFKITEFLIKDKDFTPENSNFNVHCLGGDDGALLLQACQYGFFSVAKFLLHYQSDDSKNNFLRWAVEEYSNEVAKKFMRHKDAKLRSTPLYEAAHKGKESLTLLHKGVVQLLLDNGANVNTQNEDKNTPLHIAAKNGRREIVQLLLDNGANVNAQNEDKNTPTYCAAKNGRREIVQLLLDNGANVNAQNEDKNTPTYCAAKKGHKDIVNFIINHINVRPSNVSTNLKELSAEPPKSEIQR